MDIDDYNVKWICADCIGDDFLSQRIMEEGEKQQCSYCENKLQTWSLPVVAGIVAEAFNDHYIRTPDEPDSMQQMMLADNEFNYDWYRDGDPTVYAIMGALDCSENLANSIQEYLEWKYADKESLEMGEECEFASEAHYMEKSPYDGEWHEEWNDFERILKQEARFFNPTAQKLLLSVFGDIENMITNAGRPVIVDAGPDHEISGFFRARVFYSDKSLKQGLMRPDIELGPPPFGVARAGRMNAHGISVFYGADTAEGAIAEVRPVVGSQTLVGRFKLIRPIKLLDFSALESVSELGSIFDPEYTNRCARKTFLWSLMRRMSRPVMPADEGIEYLATQVLVDFLANGLSVELDGVLFPSVQTNKSSTNVVLFHKSSKVSKLDLPEKAEISATVGYHTDEGYEREYSVMEQVISEGVAENENTLGRAAFFSSDEIDMMDYREHETLSIQTKGLSVFIVNAAVYETEKHEVYRHRFKSSDKFRNDL